MKNRITKVQPSSVRKGIAKPLVSGIPNRPLIFRAFDDGKMVYEKDISHLSMEDNLVLRLAKFWSNVRNDSHIMQFAGILDCNKKQIFEGDIVKWGHKKNSSECWHRYAIVQINPDLQLKIIYYKVAETQEQKPTDNHIFHWGRFSYGGSDLEIIGNVFQNPELLG
jgi:uncharacterized phage protein (TIGR01671 family)